MLKLKEEWKEEIERVVKKVFITASDFRWPNQYLCFKWGGMDFTVDSRNLVVKSVGRKPKREDMEFMMRRVLQSWMPDF